MGHRLGSARVGAGAWSTGSEFYNVTVWSFRMGCPAVPYLPITSVELIGQSDAVLVGTWACPAGVEVA